MTDTLVFRAIVDIIYLSKHIRCWLAARQFANWHRPHSRTYSIYVMTSDFN